MSKNINVFVKVDLLLHEDSFEALKTFVMRNNNINNMYSLDLDFEKNEIICTGYASEFNFAFLALIAHKLAQDYMLIPLEELKKFLSIS